MASLSSPTTKLLVSGIRLENLLIRHAARIINFQNWSLSIAFTLFPKGNRRKDLLIANINTDDVNTPDINTAGKNTGGRVDPLSQPVRHANFGERGDVPGWVLVVLMTAGLVTGIWTVAAPRLNQILRTSLDSMNSIR